ncbi:MAG: GMP/IMP nucleotidase [Gammaproteobacteria bacterium]|nr:GMP/IMP nucleotidase [Gammaproteobacteria bacterium]
MNNYLVWQEIKTVFLDLDGTLLDLHFDNHFWLEYVPVCFADKHELTHEQANDALMSRYKDAKGKLDWYCVDFWTRELGLDIEQMKHEVAHKIAVRPEVREFLQAIKNSGKRIVLVTNAHPASLSLKMKKTGLDMYFDRMINAHDLGLAKEHDGFWNSLHEMEPFESAHTLLIDDNLEVLESAEHYGIKYLLAILQPDSQADEVETKHFHAVHRFSEVMPR